MLRRFAERLAAVQGVLHVVEDPLPVLHELIGSASVAAWAEAGVASTAAAAGAEVSLIVADVGVADTGQVGFAHGAARPRDVALLPDRQIVLLPRDALVGSLAEALARVRGPSVVFIAGPSRTADIEQRHMLGVHAPRTLDVVLHG